MFRFLVLCSCWLSLLPALANAQSVKEMVTDFLTEKGGDYQACFRLPGLEGMQSALPEQVVEPAEPVLRRIVLAVDASGSMAGRVGGQSKMDAAKRGALEFLGSLPTDVEVGLIAFGHRGNNQQSGRSESCAGVEMLMPVGSDRAAQGSAINRLSATGWTPLAAAITQAGSAFEPSKLPGEQAVFVLSDGKETCGGDPVSAARNLVQGDIRAIVNIIGFDLTAEDRAQLMAVAEAGGGRFEEPDAENLSADLGQTLFGLALGGKMLAVEAEAGRLTVANNAESASVLTAMNSCIALASINENRALGFAGMGLAGNDSWSKAQELIKLRQERMLKIADLLAQTGSLNLAAVNAAISHDVEGTRAQFEASINE